MNAKTLRRIIPFIVLTVVFAALLYRAEHKAETGISQVDRHITEVTSPCLRYGPSSRQCKRSFEAAVATIDHAEACAVLRKAGLRVDSCRGARLAQEERQRVQEAKPKPTASAAAPEPEGGGANSSPSTGHSLPGRHEGGSTGTDRPSHPAAPSVPHQSAPSTEGSMGAAAPTAPSSPGASSPPSTEPPTEAPVEERSPTPEAPVRQGAGVLLESVGGVVEETGGTVNEVVSGVTGTTCLLAKVLCHE